MIKINLLGEQRDRSASYFVHAVGLICLVFILVVSGAWFSAHLVTAKGELEFDRTTKESQLAKLKLKTQKVEDLEKKKKLLGEKLEIIAKLKIKKQGPVKLLDEIATKIPEKAWLTGIVQKDETIELNGIALDGQVVSDFVSNMRGSKLISDADNVKTEQILIDNIKMQKFNFPIVLGNYFKPKEAEGSVKPTRGKKSKK